MPAIAPIPHRRRDIPTLPVPLRAIAGETKIPDPTVNQF